MFWIIFSGLLLAVASYFAWAAIHEFSHLFVAKKFVNVVKWKMKLYPHKAEDGSWRFAAVWYWMDRNFTPKEQFAVSLAPRLPGLVACVLFPLGALFSGPLYLLWSMFWGGGVVDLLYGSIGVSENSDLKKAARASGKSPWLFRAAGFAVGALSTLVHFLI